MYQNQNDETLVMLTLAGEQSAYEILVARYENAVIASAASVTHNRHMAEDSAQDAFITAWIKLNMLREPEKYGTWVCRIAKNCAKNTVMRFRSFISLDDPDEPAAYSAHGKQPDPFDTCELSEENTLLHESIEKLPEKVRRIINLHYFEDLTVNEIALKMGIAEGTVKWQLHEGRKRIRKELCAMNEEYNDTMVQKVMKKVEELKLWQYKNSKKGFKKVYKEVLKEVQELPESMDKYHALADVLMRGWWWINGDKNDALFERIRDAAEKGHNDDVMEFVAAKEDSKLYGGAKISFIKETQIPRLEKGGFVKALAAEWSSLGYTYCDQDEYEKAIEAYEKGLAVVKPSDLYYYHLKAAADLEKKHCGEYKDKDFKRWVLTNSVGEYKREGGLRRWDGKMYVIGGLTSEDFDADNIFYNASLCDGFFTVEGLKEGERYTGSDGSTIEFTESGTTVTAPCGNFEGCMLWTVNHKHAVYRTYYKEGIGIVKAENSFNGFTETRLLREYEIKGGSGIIPLCEGNKWSYTSGADPDFLKHSCECQVVFKGEKSVILSCVGSMERIAYNENSWTDMIFQVRNDYCKGVSWHENKIADVSFPIKRARELAETSLEKAHTKAACSVAERILATDPEFNPDCTEIGLWNFFRYNALYKQDDKTMIRDDFRFDFEWKRMSNTEEHPEYPLLFNHIYSILSDGANCIWCDKWKEGYKEEITAEPWDDGTIIQTKISCESAGTVETKAGTFENCLRVSLDIGKYGEFMDYRSGKKEYYFAPGIGIVKIVHHYMDGLLTSVYELTYYEGEGEGYMPSADGLVRKYEAVGLTDGYAAGAEYTYAADKDGHIYILEDNSGIRKKPVAATVYAKTCGEELEEKLWQEGRRDMGNIRHDILDESRLRHDINTFCLFIHFLNQNDRSWYAPERKTSQGKHRMRIFETLGEKNGEVPKAWLGAYARQCFITGCSMLGSGNREEGYPYLDRAFELFKEWDGIPDGELLETGDKFIFGGIKVIKGKSNVIVLPDGTEEIIREDGFFFNINGAEMMYYAMTALHGWEWFDGVREEERFKKAVDKAKKLIK